MSISAMRAGTRRRIALPVIFGAGIFMAPTRLGHALERMPFLFTFAVKALVYGSVVALVVGGGIGWRVVAAAPPLLGSGLHAEMSEHIGTPAVPRMARTLVLVSLAILVLQLGRLTGDRTLRDIVLGRYHRSRTEERFFLFVDIVGSTPLGERLGPEAIHRFLGEVFRLVSEPLGPQRLRGRAAPIQIYALRRGPARDASTPSAPGRNVPALQ